MNPGDNLNICFMGSNQAGMIGALTILSKGARMLSAVSYTDDLTDLLKFFRIPVYRSINEKGFAEKLKMSDLLVSVHGKEIVGAGLLKLPRFGAVNLHPYLYKYKGADPVGRALKDGEFRASVGAHLMEEKVDEGYVVAEEFIDVSGAKSAEEVYNRLYPCYSRIMLKALSAIGLKAKNHAKNAA